MKELREILEQAIITLDRLDAAEAKRRKQERIKLRPVWTNNAAYVDEYIRCIPAGE